MSSEIFDCVMNVTARFVMNFVHIKRLLMVQFLFFFPSSLPIFSSHYVQTETALVSLGVNGDRT